MAHPDSMISVNNTLKYMEQLGVDIVNNALNAKTMILTAISSGLIGNDYTHPLIESLGHISPGTDDLDAVYTALDKAISPSNSEKSAWRFDTGQPKAINTVNWLIAFGEKIAFRALKGRMSTKIDTEALAQFQPRNAMEITLIRLRSSVNEICSDLYTRGMRITAEQLADYRAHIHG